MINTELHNGDCLEYMKKIPTSSIDLIITDPPYNLGKFMEERDTNLVKMRDNFFGAAGWDDLDYKEWKKSMNKFFHQASRVLKDGGSIIVFMAIIKVETIIQLAQKHGLYYKTKPQYFVMENVPNLLTAEKGYFKREIEELFSKMGYILDAGVLNAADYGVPQNRRRAVIIGKKTNEERVNLLPKPINKKVSVWDAISDLAYLNSGEGDEIQDYKFEARSEYQKKMRMNSNKLLNHKATNHSKLALERLALVPPEQGKECLPEEHLTKSIYSGTWCRMQKDDVSVTITTRFDTPSSGRFTHPYLNRAITVREAARIQSFPDTFEFVGPKVSQMKQVGNAVPPLLANKIADSILNDIT